MTINQSSTNELILYAKSGLATPTFLIRFVNRITAKEFVCLSTSVECPFLKLTVIEVGRTGTEDPVNGSIKIDTGSYEIYFYDQSSSSNLDYTLTNSLLRKEFGYVYSDEDVDRTFW